MPRLPRLSSARIAIAAASAFLLVQIARLILLCRLPDDKLVPFIPDDAFYYLTLGRNFAELHRWTFDRVDPATGFHLLWGYGLAALFSIAPHLGFRSMFVLLFLFGAICIAGSLYLASRLVAERLGRFAVLGLFAIFCSALSLQMTNLLMEAPLVLLCSAGVLYNIMVGPPTRRRMLCAIALGFLGMVARSDFGVLPLLLTVAAYVVRAPMRRTAAATLLGSVLGLGGVVAHTFAVSGHLYQGSTRAKRQWSTLSHDSLRVTLKFATLPLHAHPDAGTYSHRERNDILKIAMLSGLGLLCAWTRRQPDVVALITAASLLPFGYILLYRYDSAALQPWYYSNFIIPYGLTAAAVLSIRLQPVRVVAVLGALLWCGNGFFRSLQPVWPGQTGFYEAALYLRRHPELQNVGAWNAGILHYFSGASVVNIDGLVNDTADDYILHDHLAQYLQKRNLHYILDDVRMVTAPQLRRRGGYTSGQLTRCILHTEPVWTDRPSTSLGNHVALFTLSSPCLQ